MEYYTVWTALAGSESQTRRNDRIPPVTLSRRGRPGSPTGRHSTQASDGSHCHDTTVLLYYGITSSTFTGIFTKPCQVLQCPFLEFLNLEPHRHSFALTGTGTVTQPASEAVSASVTGMMIRASIMMQIEAALPVQA